MSEYEDKTLKFLQNHTYNITLAANEPETGTNSQGGIFRKYKIVEGTYPCTKKGIDGKPEKDADGKEIAVEKSCDCFFASDKLHEKIQSGNFGTGFKLALEKVYDTKVFQHPFFKVTPMGDGSTLKSATMEEAVDMVAKTMDMNQPNPVVNNAPAEAKKLTGEERLSFLEEKVKTLWQERQESKGHKTDTGDPVDDLPF